MRAARIRIGRITPKLQRGYNVGLRGSFDGATRQFPIMYDGKQVPHYMIWRRYAPNLIANGAWFSCDPAWKREMI